MKTSEQITKEIQYARDMYDATIERLKKDLEAARAAEEAEKNKPWVPKVVESYWCVTANGSTNCTRNDGSSFDKECIARRNCFPIREEAEADEEKRTVTNLLKDAATKAGRKNGEFVPGVNNWLLSLNRMWEDFCTESFTVAAFANAVYFPSRESLLTAISEIGEDRIKRVLFGVTE